MFVVLLLCPSCAPPVLKRSLFKRGHQCQRRNLAKMRRPWAVYQFCQLANTQPAEQYVWSCLTVISMFSFQFIFCRIYRLFLYVIAHKYFPSQFPFGVKCMPVLYICVLTGAAVFILYRLFLHSYRVLPHILCCYVSFSCLLEYKKTLVILQLWLCTSPHVSKKTICMICVQRWVSFPSSYYILLNSTSTYFISLLKNASVWRQHQI